MNYRLYISSNYTSIIIALTRDADVLETHSIDKKFGNQRLLLDIDVLLKRHEITLSDIAAIGVNAGPAPYTSLRIVLATANGLHAATNIPLFGIDALKTFLYAHPPKDSQHATVALLNAFNNDLFYGIARYERPIQTGYEKSEKLLERLHHELDGLTINWIGNGVQGSTDFDYPTIEQLIAYDLNHPAEKASGSVLPLYLKQIRIVQ